MYLKVTFIPGLYYKLGTKPFLLGGEESLQIPLSEKGYFIMCWEK